MASSRPRSHTLTFRIARPRPGSRERRHPIRTRTSVFGERERRVLADAPASHRRPPLSTSASFISAMVAYSTRASASAISARVRLAVGGGVSVVSVSRPDDPSLSGYFLLHRKGQGRERVKPQRIVVCPTLPDPAQVLVQQMIDWPAGGEATRQK